MVFVNVVVREARSFQTEGENITAGCWLGAGGKGKGWDGMGSKGKGWDGKGWDEKGWDEKGWEGMG